MARQVPDERGREPLHSGARPGGPAAPRRRRGPVRPAARRPGAGERARPQRPGGEG